MLELISVTRKYGQTVAVNKLTFECGEKEFLVIFGPAGAGKSTTLRLIAGVLEPTRGEIRFRGESMSHVPPEQRNISMVFENYALYSHMTVFENLAFPLRAKKLSESEIRRRVGKMAEVLQLSSFLDRRPGFLSGGQRQRVALGRGLIREADIYLLDEPISHLDAKLRHLMRAELKAMSADLNANIILVTTSSREAMALGQRIAILNNGKLEQIGTPSEIYHKPANEFVASFVGEPPMSILDVEPARERGVHLFRVKGSNACLPVPPQLETNLNGETQGYKLGVRASEITIASREDADHHMPAEVFIVEHMGYSNIVSAKVGEGLIRVIVPAEICPAIRERVWLSLDADHMHLFYRDKAVGHPTSLQSEALI